MFAEKNFIYFMNFAQSVWISIVSEFGEYWEAFKIEAGFAIGRAIISIFAHMMMIMEELLRSRDEDDFWIYSESDEINDLGGN